METILTFAQTVSPIGVIALLVIVVFQLTGGKNLVDKFKGTQVPKENNNDTVNLDTINKKLNLIASNHLHELPDMKLALDRIELKQSEQGERLAGVEAKIQILLK